VLAARHSHTDSAVGMKKDRNLYTTEYTVSKYVLHSVFSLYFAKYASCRKNPHLKLVKAEVKVNLSLCFTKHDAMEGCGGEWRCSYTHS